MTEDPTPNAEAVLSILRSELPSFNTAFESAYRHAISHSASPQAVNAPNNTLLLEIGKGGTEKPRFMNLFMLGPGLRPSEVYEIPIARLTRKGKLQHLGVMSETQLRDDWLRRHQEKTIFPIPNRSLFSLVQAIFAADKSPSKGKANMIGINDSMLPQTHPEAKRLHDALRIVSEMEWKRRIWDKIDINEAIKFL